MSELNAHALDGAAAAGNVLTREDGGATRGRSPELPERTGHGWVTPQPGGGVRCLGESRGCEVCVEERRVLNESLAEARRREVAEAVGLETAALHTQAATLVAPLTALYPSTLSHGQDPAWEVLTMETPAGQMCFSIRTWDVDKFRHVPRGRPPQPYDGHNLEDRAARLAAVTQALLAQRAAPDLQGGEAAEAVARPFIKITIPEGMTETELAARVAAALEPIPARPAPEPEVEPEPEGPWSDEDAWARIGNALALAMRAEFGQTAVPA